MDIHEIEVPHAATVESQQQTKMAAATQDICIEWEGHGEALLNGIRHTFHNQLVVDTTLTCHQQGVRVHRLILAIFFPMLRDSSENLVLTSSSGGELCLDHIVCSGSSRNDDDDRGGDILKYLVEFAYSGKVTLPRDRLQSVLVAADLVGFKGLAATIVQAMQQKMLHQMASSSSSSTDCCVSSLVEDDECSRHEPPPESDKVASTDDVRTYDDDVHHSEVKNEILQTVNVTSAESILKRTNRKGVPVKIAQVLEPLRGSDRGTVLESPGCTDTMQLRSRRSQRTSSKTTSPADSDQDEDSVKSDEDSAVSSSSSSFTATTNVPKGKKRPTRKRRTTTTTAAADGKSSSLRKRIRKQFTCHQCNYATSNKETYNNHLSKHDPLLQSERFDCDVCSKSFRSRKGYRYHMITHSDPALQHKCDHCPFSTPQRWTWRQHLAVKHKVDEQGNPVEDSIKCNQCEFVCVASHQLKAHMIRKHTLDKPFKCSQCSYATITRSELDKHVRIQHRKERDYMCESCGFRSQTHNGLTRHKRGHLGIKPFRCELCGMEYADRGKYRSHLQRHTSDEKPFICHICGHACRRRDNLRMHLKRIHRINLDRGSMTSLDDCCTDTKVLMDSSTDDHVSVFSVTAAVV